MRRPVLQNVMHRSPISCGLLFLKPHLLRYLKSDTYPEHRYNLYELAGKSWDWTGKLPVCESPVMQYITGLSENTNTYNISTIFLSQNHIIVNVNLFPMVWQNSLLLFWKKILIQLNLIFSCNVRLKVIF